MKKIGKYLGVIVCIMFLASGCDESTIKTVNTQTDVRNTLDVGDKLVTNQPTPTDIDYSLERFNLIKRAYWVNGMRDKARSLPSPITDMPFGYIVLLTESGSIVGKFTVDGKVSSLNSYLTPDSEYYEEKRCEANDNSGRCSNNEWLPDVDGSYGNNDNGIFFFTTDGKYIEWTGTYLYSDLPFIVADPIVKVGE